jgi:hypothetical protein
MANLRLSLPTCFAVWCIQCDEFLTSGREDAGD